MATTLNKLRCRTLWFDFTAFQPIRQQCKYYTTIQHICKHHKSTHINRMHNFTQYTPHNKLHTTNYTFDDTDTTKSTESTEPELTEEQKQAEQNKIIDFLKPIKCDEFADKFVTFNELLTTHSIFLKLKHSIPVKQRKLIRQAVERYKHKQFVLQRHSYLTELKRIEAEEAALLQQIETKEADKIEQQYKNQPAEFA